MKDQLLASRSISTNATSSAGSALKSPIANSSTKPTASVSKVSTSMSVGTATSATTTLSPILFSVTDTDVIPSGRLHLAASPKSSRHLLSTCKATPTAVNKAAEQIAEQVGAAFRDPFSSFAYFHSLAFCADLVELSGLAGAVLQTEARCLTLTSPVYVIGDLHGNLTDLGFFAERIWQPLGVSLTAGNLLFLGDYVDRGTASLEVAAYVLALKVLHPNKVFLLRGNHETRAVNGLEMLYGSTCLLAQCKARFGDDRGSSLWDSINHAFDRLPLAAVIDRDVFCVHGGIPRPLVGYPERTTLEAIKKLPAVARIDSLDAINHGSASSLAPVQASMMAEMLWGDPSQDDEALDAQGFGRNTRGGAAVTFSERAVDEFLQRHGLSCILRAHEAVVDGVAIAKTARVVTVFSTSKDHGAGSRATCGCVLVESQEIRVFNRSPDFGRHQEREQLPRRRASVAGSRVATYGLPMMVSGAAWQGAVVINSTSGSCDGGESSGASRSMRISDSHRGYDRAGDDDTDDDEEDDEQDVRERESEIVSTSEAHQNGGYDGEDNNQEDDD